MTGTECTFTTTNETAIHFHAHLSLSWMIEFHFLLPVSLTLPGKLLGCYLNFALQITEQGHQQEENLQLPRHEASIASSSSRGIPLNASRALCTVGSCQLGDQNTFTPLDCGPSSLLLTY